MNANHVSPSSRPALKPKPITQAQIAALAHELWLERGCPAGSDLDIWLEAERRLQGDVSRPMPRRDPIPADPANPDADHDPAVNSEVAREVGEAVDRVPPRRSPTSLT